MTNNLQLYQSGIYGSTDIRNGLFRVEKSQNKGTWGINTLYKAISVGMQVDLYGEQGFNIDLNVHTYEISVIVFTPKT